MSPSSVVLAPPRTRNRPWYFAFAGPASLAYSPYFSGSVTLLCAMMFAPTAFLLLDSGDGSARASENATSRSHRSVVETFAHHPPRAPAVNGHHTSAGCTEITRGV